MQHVTFRNHHEAREVAAEAHALTPILNSVRDKRNFKNGRARRCFCSLWLVPLPLEPLSAAPMAEGPTKKFLCRLEVNHEPGLNHAQLMLMVGLDTQRIPSTGSLIRTFFLERRFAPSASREEDVGCLEFCGLLGRRQFQHQHVRYMLSSSSFLIKIPVLVSWMIASSMVTLGLSPWQAWGCVWIGYSLVAPFIVLNARPGAILHVTFPVVARMSFGIWGSLWCVFNRAAMAW